MFWRSSPICWAMFVFFAVMSVVWQFVDVKPYPNMYRDYVVGTVCLSAATGFFLVLALRSQLAKRKQQ
jgi:hypothetical protein